MIINIKVKPGSSEQKIKKISETEYEIKLKEKAENNKANLKLIRLLKKYFNAEIKIKSGLKSRKKIVEVLN